MVSANRIIGIILIAFSGVVWYLASGFPQQGGAGPGAAFFPQALSVILIIIAVSILAVNPVTEKITKFSGEQLLKFSAVIFIVIMKVFFIPVLGFSATTFIAVTLIIMIVEKVSLIKAVITAVLITAAVYAAFRFLFNVPLPQGLLF